MTGTPRRALRSFWNRAYAENVTGMASMVAFNLLLATFPVALLVLFVFGQVLQSPGVEASVVRDLQELFPDTEHSTIERAVERIRTGSAGFGVAALIGGLWIGASFWGAMDTAFCRIYHVECRGWVEQKRFSLGMLVVVVLLIVASVALPTIESLIASSVEGLPFGLSETDTPLNAALVAGTALLTFWVMCFVYWAVPKGHLPWRGVWPGALFATLCVGAANWIFPLYLVNVSIVGELGRIVSFVLVALIWFYALSLAILAGAVINALRYELHDTGTLPEWPAEPDRASPPTS